MNFTAYIERQKKLIRSKHEGETKDKEDLSESEKLFSALNSLKGLNTRERLKMNGII